MDRDLRLFVMDLQVSSAEINFTWVYDGRSVPLDLLMPMACCNSEVELLPSPELPYEEGCLSFPGIRGTIRRPDRIRLNFQDLEGNPHTLECSGLFGRVIQHEHDHTRGVLFIDKMDKEDLRRVESRIKKLKRKTRDFLKSTRK